jgi:hypothetical protein
MILRIFIMFCPLQAMLPGANQNRQTKWSRKKEKVDSNMNNVYPSSTIDQEPTSRSKTAADKAAGKPAGVRRRSVCGNGDKGPVIPDTDKDGLSDGVKKLEITSTGGFQGAKDRISSKNPTSEQKGGNERSGKQETSSGRGDASPDDRSLVQDGVREETGRYVERRGKGIKYSSSRQARKQTASASANQLGK